MKKNKKTNGLLLAGMIAGIGAVAVWGATRVIADEKKDAHADHEHDHDHDHEHGEKVAGPNGGRILHSVEPHLEFLVTEDRKIRISALDDDFKVVPIGDQQVSFIGGSRTSPTRLSFAKKDGYLVSDGALPEGKNFPAILQIKVTPDAKPVLDRFQLDLNDCPTCKYLEYACTCDHGHEGHDHEGHDHKHDSKPPKSLKR